jgi:hypothetical protein
MKFQGIGRILLCAGLSALAAGARAQTLPPLDQQKAWTEADKQQFLNYLNSNSPAPKGDVKDVAAPAGQNWSEHPARALEAGPASITLFPFSGNRYSGTVGPAAGGKILAEQHLVPWFRGYAGFEAEPLRQRRSDGAYAGLTRFAAPVGLEFALVPLSTPETRYVLLRAGIAASEITSSVKGSAFNTPLVGTSAAWNIGLGYEWQFANSNWRLNAALDGLRSIASRGGTGYYGLGMTTAAAYTF